MVVIWNVNSIIAGPKCLAAKSCTRKRSWKWIQRILYLYTKVYTVLQQDIAVIVIPVWVMALYSTHHKFSSRTQHNDAHVIDNNEKNFIIPWNNYTVIITYNMRFNFVHILCLRSILFSPPSSLSLSLSPSLSLSLSLTHTHTHTQIYKLVRTCRIRKMFIFRRRSCIPYRKYLRVFVYIKKNFNDKFQN